MFGIIVGTHGRFAEELVKSCEMICGEQKNVRAVTLVPGEGPDDVVKKYEAAIKELDCDGGVLFLNESIGLRSACGIVLIFAAALLLYFTKDKDKAPKNA